MTDLASRLRAAGCVFAEEEAALLLEAAADAGQLERLVAAREAGASLEQLLGRVDFGGLRLSVGPGVFVPRRRSLRLARAAARLAAERAAPVVVELCCGAAPFAAFVAARVPAARIHAADVDPTALAHARRNLPAGAGVHLGTGFAALPAALRGRVDLAVAVPPYVPDGERALLPHGTLDHEPERALLAGPDGLAVVRALLAEAPDWLAPGGRILLELHRAQVAPAAATARAAGLRPRRRAVAADGQTGLLDAASPAALVE